MKGPIYLIMNMQEHITWAGQVCLQTQWNCTNHWWEISLTFSFRCSVPSLSWSIACNCFDPFVVIQFDWEH